MISTNSPSIPRVKALPLIGSALSLAQDPLAFLIKQYRTYGPIYRIEAGGRAMTALAGPDANIFATREGDKHWNSKDMWEPFASEINSQHFLAAIDGEDHSRLRKITKKPYSKEFAMAQLPALMNVTHDVTQSWSAGQIIEVHKFVQRLVAEQIGQMVLGKGPGPYLDDFIIFMKTLLNVVTGRWPRLTLKRPNYLQAKARVMNLAASLLERDSVRELDDERADLIDYLLRSQKENQDLLTEPEMLIGAIGPFLAGIDTSAGTISFMLYALFKHPELLPEIRSELDSGLQDGPLSETKLRSMPALHAAMQETFRRFPVAPVLTRTVYKDFEFKGYTVKAGTSVMVATGVAHFDEKLYPDPDRFEPSRCRAPRNEHRQPGAYAPFGLGSHTCAGAGFAEVQVAATIATLLHKFDLELPTGYILKTVYNPAPAPEAQFKIKVKSRRV